jgi:hypothetical protein
MAREKEHYRETLVFLSDKNVPPMLSAKQVMETLEIGHSSFDNLISEGWLKPVGGKYPIGQIAKILCS